MQTIPATSYGPLPAVTIQSLSFLNSQARRAAYVAVQRSHTRRQLDLSRQRKASLSAPADEEEFDSELRPGFELIEQGEKERALQFFENQHAIHPGSALTSLGMAAALSELGRHLESLQFAAQAITLDQSNPVMTFYGGLMHYRASSFDTAHNLLSQSAERYAELYGSSWHPDVPAQLNSILAYTAAALGHLDETVSLLERHISVFPPEPAALVLLSQISAGKNDFEKAVSHLDRCLLLFPDNAEAHYVRGQIYCRYQQYDLAVRHFSKSVAIDSSSKRFWLAYADTLAEADHNDLSLSAYNRLIEIDPSDDVSRYSRGDHFFKLKLYDAAIEDLRLVTQSTSSVVLADAKLTLAASLSYQGKFEEALVIYQGLITDGGAATYYAESAKALRELGRLNESLVSINQALSCQPDNPDFHSVKSLTLVELNRYDESIDEINKALLMSPDDFRYNYHRGFVHHRFNRLDLALNDYERTIAIKPDLPEVRDAICEIFEDPAIYDTLGGTFSRDRLNNLLTAVGKLKEYDFALLLNRVPESRRSEVVAITTAVLDAAARGVLVNLVKTNDSVKIEIVGQTLQSEPTSEGHLAWDGHPRQGPAVETASPSHIRFVRSCHSRIDLG